MVTQIRKGARRHVYLREWRLHKDVKATAMAERLGIERESYYRLERNPKTLSVGEVFELADRLGIEAEQLYRPPDTQESLDTLVKGIPDDQRAVALDIVKRLVGKTG